MDNIKSYLSDKLQWGVWSVKLKYQKTWVNQNISSIMNY